MLSAATSAFQAAVRVFSKIFARVIVHFEKRVLFCSYYLFFLGRVLGSKSLKKTAPAVFLYYYGYV